MELCAGAVGARGVRGESKRKSLRCFVKSQASVVSRERGQEREGGGSGRLVNDCFDAAD